MTGTYRIDVVTFHIDQVMTGFCKSYGTTCQRAEFVTVYPVEYYTPAIYLHDAVFNLKTAESDSERNDLGTDVIAIAQGQ